MMIGVSILVHDDDLLSRLFTSGESIHKRKGLEQIRCNCHDRALVTAHQRDFSKSQWGLGRGKGGGGWMTRD